MAKAKHINKTAMVTPHEVLAIVCKYYGLRDVKQLTAPTRLSSWRYSIHEEARQIACFLLHRHCDLSEEELQAGLKPLQWNSIRIRMTAEQAKRKLTSGDFEFCLGVVNIEKLILATFVRPYSHLKWSKADYLE